MNLHHDDGGSRAAQPHSEPEREFNGVWIPASLWKRRDLTWLQKCILAEIDSLKRGCFASNAYLAKHMGIPERTLTNNLAELRKKNLIIDWGFNGRFRQISVADEISSNPQHTRNRVGRVPAGGLADPPESGPIDTRVVTRRDSNQTKETAVRSSRLSLAERDRILREEIEVPHDAPSDQELAEIISRFPAVKKFRSDMFGYIKGSKYHHWNIRRQRWEKINNFVKYLQPLEAKFLKRGRK